MQNICGWLWHIKRYATEEHFYRVALDKIQILQTLSANVEFFDRIRLAFTAPSLRGKKLNFKIRVYILLITVKQRHLYVKSQLLKN